MSDTGYESQELNHLGIIAGICFEIELIKEIDACVDSGEREITAGEAVQAMILNALGFANRALYLTSKFFENKPVEHLIRAGVCAEDLNDDTLGRTLDVLYETGVTEVFARVASHALRIYEIEHETCHLDSTTISLHGEYNEDEDTQAIKIVHGHSKQRPDLKQAVVSLICAYKSSIPLWLEIHSGNEVDKALFPKIIENYLAQMEEGEEICIVADSALYSKDSIASFPAGLLWITRVPESISEAKRLIAEADVNDMDDAQKAGYKFSEVSSQYGGVEQRWLIVYSKAIYESEEKALQKKIAKEKESARKQLWHLENQEFSTPQEAIAALETIEKSLKYHFCSAELVRVEHHRRGRPRAEAAPNTIGYKLKVTLFEDRNRIALVEKSLGKYILATNQIDNEKMPADKMLATYQTQPASVERGFRFLKDPMFFASGLFLKNSNRIMALLMVMGLALLVYSLAERKLRLNLVEKNETVPNQVGKPVQNPTIRWVFQIFQGIHVLIIKERLSTRQLVLNLTPVQLKIIHLLGVEVEKCYFFP